MVEFVANAEHPVIIPCDIVELNGLLYIPRHVVAVVIFVHGSGSGRLSPRNQYIAKELQRANIATLLFDLLTEKEDAIDNKTMEYRFDIELLAKRLVTTTKWLLENPVLHKLPMGYFGASTGGGAALLAAAADKNHIKAVVSRGGRPDLAGDALYEVKAATLLIVGGEDDAVIELNEKAYARLLCIKKLDLIDGATHLFEEPGKLEQASHLAVSWFEQYLK